MASSKPTSEVDAKPKKQSKAERSIDEDEPVLVKTVERKKGANEKGSKERNATATTEMTREDHGPSRDEDEKPRKKEKDEKSGETNEKRKKKSSKPLKMDVTTAFMNKTLNRGLKDIVTEFRDEKRGNDFTKMKVFVENNPEGRNRYKDVGCLDETRVPLTLGPVPYIHANYVSGHTNPKRFICTQAPVDKTIADFWHMIVQEKVGYIVMLCNLKEQGVNKCANYFPTSVAKAVEVNGISVNATKIGNQKFLYSTKIVVQRTELCVIVPGQKPHKCYHLWWKDWPDRGVPPTDLAPIELCGRLNSYSRSTGAPIIVHCSAGIGRTGSIVLIDLLLELLRAGVPWEETLLGYMKKLRQQRNNSVQTEHQYLYVHQVMLNFLVNYQGLGKKDPKLAERMEKFTAEYNKYCAGF